MEKRIEVESSYRLFSHSGQEAFINDYYELLPLENDNQSFLFDFGQLLRSFGRYSDSNAILQKGTMVSNDPMFYVLIGNNYKDMKCYDLSEMAYQKAFLDATKGNVAENTMNYNSNEEGGVTIQTSGGNIEIHYSNQDEVEFSSKYFDVIITFVQN